MIRDPQPPKPCLVLCKAVLSVSVQRRNLLAYRGTRVKGVLGRADLSPHFFGPNKKFQIRKFICSREKWLGGGGWCPPIFFLARRPCRGGTPRPLHRRVQGAFMKKCPNGVRATAPGSGRENPAGISTAGSPQHTHG